MKTDKNEAVASEVICVRAREEEVGLLLAAKRRDEALGDFVLRSALRSARDANAATATATWLDEIGATLPALLTLAQAAEVLGLGGKGGSGKGDMRGERRGRTSAPQTAAKWLREWLIQLPDKSLRVPRKDFLAFLASRRFGTKNNSAKTQ
ncbi:MAG: hypothetical protein LBR07_05165 [Puniceicoccales bacterium]|jgi:uncharacterized protein (DUF1778 family)|nr:hypothetical protein [Puniceicoccales bacterium]